MLKSRLDKPYSKFDGSCNPESPNHWLKEFIDSDELDIYVQKYTIFDNPALSPEFVDNLCKEYEGTVFYDRYIMGEWTLAEGLIYPMYRDALAEPPTGKAEQYVLSIDYGTLNAFAALLWGKYGDTWYCVDGYYYSGRNTGVQKTDEDYAKDIDAWLMNYIPNGCEKATTEFKFLPYGERLKTIIDPSAASFITLLKRKKNYRVIPADNAVLDGIRETASCMQTGKIKINPKLKFFITELEGYVWDESAVEDRPVKIDDHACDACRYFCKTMKLAVHKSDYILIWNY